MKKTYTFTLLCMVLLGMAFSAMAQKTDKNGTVATQVRPVSAFTTLKVTGSFEIILTQGTTESLRLEADEKVVDFIETKVENGVLHIQSKGIQNASNLKAYVTVRQLNHLHLSGGIKLNCTNTLKTDTLNLEFAGGIKAALALKVKELNGEMAGGTDTELTGSADKVNLQMAGANNVTALELTTNYFTLEAAGVGNAKLNVAKELTVETAGIFKVAYTGSATLRHSGMGKVKRL